MSTRTALLSDVHGNSVGLRAVLDNIMVFHSPGLWPDMPAADWQALWQLMDAHHFSQVFCGHSHVPFYREFEGRQVCNVGSAGASLDGDPRASWVLVTSAPAAPPEISIRWKAHMPRQRWVKFSKKLKGRRSCSA